MHKYQFSVDSKARKFLRNFPKVRIYLGDDLIELQVTDETGVTFGYIVEDILTWDKLVNILLIFLSEIPQEKLRTFFSLEELQLLVKNNILYEERIVDYKVIDKPESIIKKFNSSTKSYILDKKVPLDLRWEAFINWPIKWGLQYPYLLEYSSFNYKESDYFTFLSKGEVVDIALCINENTPYSNQYKEEILNLGFRSFLKVEG